MDSKQRRKEESERKKMCLNQFRVSGVERDVDYFAPTFDTAKFSCRRSQIPGY